MRGGQGRPEGRQGAVSSDDERFIVGRAQCHRVARKPGLQRRQVGAGQPPAEGAFGPEVRRFAAMVGCAQKDHASQIGGPLGSQTSAQQQASHGVGDEMKPLEALRDVALQIIRQVLRSQGCERHPNGSVGGIEDLVAFPSQGPFQPFHRDRRGVPAVEEHHGLGARIGGLKRWDGARHRHPVNRWPRNGRVRSAPDG